MKANLRDDRSAVVVEETCEVRLLVCAHVDDDEPMIAGGLNIYVWGDDPDTYEIQAQAIRDSFDPIDAMQWRDVLVRVPLEALRALFTAGPIDATVVSTDDAQASSPASAVSGSAAAPGGETD